MCPKIGLMCLCKSNAKSTVISVSPYASVATLSSLRRECFVQEGINGWDLLGYVASFDLDFKLGQ